MKRTPKNYLNILSMERKLIIEFRNERFFDKTKALSDIFKKVSLPSFESKSKDSTRLKPSKEIQKQKFKLLPRNRLILPNLNLFQCQKSYSLILFQVLYLKGILRQDQKSTC